MKFDQRSKFDARLRYKILFTYSGVGLGPGVRLCGHVNADTIKEKLFEPSDDPGCLPVRSTSHESKVCFAGAHR